MEKREALQNVIKYALWNKGIACADIYVYEELRKHAITALPAPVLSHFSLSPQLAEMWKKDILQQIRHYIQYINLQKKLPITVPYTILKGTSAAQYYQHPEYRAMGDIDIITRREDYQKACDDLIENGFVEIHHRVEKKHDRHRSFIKYGIVVEVHLFFALLNDSDKAKYLDDMIIANINPTHILPDLINGLVLLEHISQHMEEGIGFRQIIDWMMFVNKCLPDDKWDSFYDMAKAIGLERLAIITTHMCELYLGLPQRKWCEDADEVICEKLMNYIFLNGNFGIKRNTEDDISENVLVFAETPKTAIKLLQNRGLINWKLSRKYKILRPFAWMYQAFRYAVRGIRRDGAAGKIRREYNVAKERRKMFDTLGIKTSRKKIAIYKDGKYK